MQIIRNSFLKKLDKKIQEKILSMAKPRFYKKGEMIFSKDETGNTLFIVYRGKIKIFSSYGYNKKKTFVFLEPGDVFGEMALLGGKRRAASAQAMRDSEILSISKRNFKNFLLKNPNFMLRLLQVMAERLDRADREIENMLFYSMMGRLAAKLLEMSGKRTKTPIELDINQSELAEYLGTTRVPLCRAISSLKRAEILDYKKQKIIIRNLRKLEDIAVKK